MVLLILFYENERHFIWVVNFPTHYAQFYDVDERTGLLGKHFNLRMISPIFKQHKLLCDNLLMGRKIRCHVICPLTCGHSHCWLSLTRANELDGGCRT